jgi:hypothetical protein
MCSAQLAGQVEAGEIKNTIIARIKAKLQTKGMGIPNVNFSGYSLF